MKGLKIHTNRGTVPVHLAVLLFGMAGLFGKLLVLPAMIIVLGRVFFASLVLGGILLFQNKGSLKLPGFRSLIWFLGLGVLLAFHWYSFFRSIQLTTVALGLITFATFPVFTAILEPLLLKEKFELKYILLALLAGFGVFLASGGNFSDQNLLEGVIWGILSGLSFAFLSIGNRKMLDETPALKIAFYEDVVATVILLPFAFTLDYVMSGDKWMLLILLGIIFTAGAHYLFIYSLNYIKTRTASIVSSLEPVYGIIFAVILLHEVPDMITVMGCVIIIMVSMLISLLKTKEPRKNKFNPKQSGNYS